MSKFYTVWERCLKLRHVLGMGVLGVSMSVCAQNPLCKAGRSPANYVPNDDVIAVPVNAEIGFYDKYILNDNSWSEKSQVQQQIKIWQENELMAQQYGLDTQSWGNYYVPSSDEKWEWLQRSYFRYLKKRGEDPFKQEGQDILRRWTANDEVNSIDEMEAVFRATNRRTTLTGKPLPPAFQEKTTKTKKFRLQFQPRLEQGLIIVKATGPIDARAWVGVNGETEFNIQKTFATQTRLMVNYYVHSGEYLAALDQNLGGGFSARFTSVWDPENADVNVQRNQTTQLRYAAEF